MEDGMTTDFSPSQLIHLMDDEVCLNARVALR